MTASILRLVLPASLPAQGSPDIIWKRQVSVDRVNSVIFTSNGETLISGGSDRLINLWRTSDGTLLQTLNTNAPFVHASAIENLSITADGSLLASCSYKLVQLWSLPSGNVRNLNGHTDWVVGVALSPDGSLLASASFDTTIRIWRPSDGTLLKTLTGAGQQRCVAFSPDGSLLAAGSGTDVVRVWRTSDWTLVKTLSGHTEDIFVVAFSPDGKTIASGGYDDTVKLWNVADGTLKYTFGGNGGNVYGLAFTPDGTKLAYTDGEGSTVKIYNTATGTLIRTFTDEVNEVQTVAFSSAGLLGYGRIDETVVLAQINASASPRISSPFSGTYFSAPANITIAATPSSGGSGIAKVEFFQNGIKLGEDLASPFTFNWTNVDAGNYVLTAVETTASGTTATSAAVSINVLNQSNQPPAIALTSPATGANFTAPAKITIAADATASAGVANVEFFQDGISLGQDSKSPFAILWNSVPSGNYSLTAVVTDKNGASATAPPVNITVVAAGSETVKPKVSIRSPAAGTRLTNPDVTLVGSASDNVAVARVLYSLNNGIFSAANGTANWETSLTLVPGTNLVQVKSVDTSGNESHVASRKFIYVFSSPLSLQINGAGKVTPLRDGQILEVDKTYSVKAVPGRDSSFQGWTGSVTSSAPNLSFRMDSATALIANFIPDPFAQRKGTYLGLIQPSTPSHERSGFLRVTTTRTGNFSGKITIAGKTLSLRSRFDGGGTFTGTSPHLGLSLSLQMVLTNDSEQITGTITDGSFVSTIVANRSVFSSKGNPFSEPGKFTVLIPPSAKRPNTPQGNGFGILNVDTAGRTRITGSLADGTAFSQSAGVAKDLTWPFYVSLYGKDGSISAAIRFKNQTNVSDLDGIANWFKPPNSAARYFAEGFITQTFLIGSTYVTTTGSPVLAVPQADQNILVNLRAGDLESELQQPGTLDANNRFVIQANDQKLRLSVSPSTGAIQGSFVHPITGRITKERGAVFQKQNLAEGYFLGTAQSGLISIIPVDDQLTDKTARAPTQSNKHGKGN